MSSSIPETEPDAVDEPVTAGPTIACDLPIDRPGATAHNELVLTGWTVSPKGIAGVVVQIDGRLLHASYGLDTPWVVDNMPEMTGAAHAGYRLSLDTSGWSPGPRAVTVTAYDSEGGRGDVVGEVEILPFVEPRYGEADNLAAIAAGEVAMWLDSPTAAGEGPNAESPVEIAGWAYAAGGIEAVVVTIDGAVRYEALRPVARPDLLDAYGEEVAATAGFVLRLHERDCPPGHHSLTVVALDRDHRAVGVERDFACLPEPPPDEPPPAGEPMQIDWREGSPARPRQRQSVDRYDPDVHAGLMLQAECELRYRWAAPLAAGRSVLDAGCGTGWGTALIAEANAARVVGLDLSEEALVAARSRTEGLAVELEHGDVQALPFDDASFDLIACFNVLEHVADRSVALEELRRVLRPDGVLLVSAARRRAIARDGAPPPPGLTASELERVLRDRFASTRIHRQDTLLASTVTDEAALATGDASDELEIEVRNLGESRPGSEEHVVGVAGDGVLPELGQLALLAPSGAVRKLRDATQAWEDRALLAEADAAASRNERNLAQMQQEGTLRVAEENLRRLDEENLRRLDELSAALANAEQRESEARQALDGQAAQVAAQSVRLREQAARLDDRAARLDELEAALARAEDTAAGYRGSLSWRITRPLRAAKRLVRPRRRG